MLRNRGLRDLIAMLDGFRDRGIRTTIGAAALVACGLSPSQASAALLLSQDGTAVYDTVNNVSWLADADLAASNRFGLPVCTGSGTQPCVNPSGSMSYQAAAAWVQAMNAANYLGHTNWQLPTTPTADSGCTKINPAGGGNFGFNCSLGALGSLYYNALGLKSPNTAVPIPSNTFGSFSNFQPFLYWSRSSAGASGYFSFSFNNGFKGANTAPNFLYVLPMIAGKISGTPAASGKGLEVNPGGQTVYDPVTNVTWLANANLAATNTFGLPYCSSPTSPTVCVNQDGAMTWDSASQFVTNMNTYNGTGYLGQSYWELPPMDACGGYHCANSGEPLAELYSDQLGLSPGTPVVATPNIAVGPFKNIQPYLYWSCEGATIQDACQTAVPSPGFEWSFSFGNGFLGTDLLENDLYVTAYFVGSPSTPCTYSLSSGGQVFTAAGGSGSIAITTAPGCAWSAAGAPSWVTGTTSGSGNGTLSYQVTANNGADRTATITVAGYSFTIEQEAASISGLNFIGSMPHIAAEENWTTAFTLVNKSSAPATARFSFFGDPTDASGNGPLTLPLAFPQVQPAPLPELAASLDRTLGANASLIISTPVEPAPTSLTGSAQLAAMGQVDGFAIFHLIPGAQEAVVPMETRNAISYLLPFDNTSGVVLAVAVANVSSQMADIGVVIRDDTGAQIGTPGTTLTLPANGHMSFVSSDPVHGFPVTASKRGTVEFDTPSGGQISVLGIRTTPLGSSNTLTTIPALANVGTGGGSFAFLASGGDGWQTTFVLVNTSTSAAPVTLRFLAPNGNPLPLPLSFPQSGGGTTTLAASVPRTLAGGETLIVQSAGAPTLLTGSAQLASSGHVSGFAIFRYNPSGQEAVVPLESRNAGAYLLAFDNTSGTATGIAVNNVSASSQQVSIPVVIRNDMGNTLAQYNLPLAANGEFSGDLAQYSATLGNVLFPETANIRGTIEFDAPSPSVQVGVIGIRTPATRTYTTLPALAK
jgi:hypothetical protein